jgi:hypothetical protein
VLARLAGLTAAGAFDAPRVAARAAELLRRRGMLLMLSDFYDAEAETLTELKRASRRGHEAGVLQVLSRAELDFPFSGGHEFVALEGEATRLADAGAVARGYRARMADFLEWWRTGALKGGLDYARFITDEPLDEALRRYLLRRGAGHDRTPLESAAR